MEEFAYQFLINFTALFIIWCIWFGIAAKLHNKNQMIRATELTVSLFITRMFGLLGILIAFILYFIIKKAVAKKESEPKRETYNEYIERLEKEKAEEGKVEEVKHEVICTPPTPVEKVAHNIKPTKEVRSKKPLILVTYVLLIAIIIALSVFCVLSVKDIKEKESTISRLEADITVLEGDLKAVENNLKRKDSDLKVANAKISDNNRLLQSKIDELKTAQSDIEYWKNKYIASGSSNVSYSYEFTSVNALLTAIKKNPEAYHNKQVKVFGMIFTYEISKKTIGLIDYKIENLSSYGSGLMAGIFMDKKIEAKEGIEVTLLNDMQYTVAETGDYVNLYGTVRITNGEIYLDMCQYN